MSKRMQRSLPFIVFVLFASKIGDLVDAACSCRNLFTNTSFPSNICCDLGSTTCDSSLRAQASCVKDGEVCPRTVYSQSAGHFISSSMSWRAKSGNTVEFEILSTWRLSFSWPYPLSTAYTGPCGYPGIGDKVPLVGISPGASETDPQQSSTGSVSVKLETGEVGKSFDLFMIVKAFSVEEDWISGISIVEVTYSRPYASTVPYFPVGKYVASVSNKDTTQPYRTIPWVASFSGCCRQFQSLNQDRVLGWNFQVKAQVDLSDTRGSARIVSLPQLWLDAPTSETTPTTSSIVICAIPVGGPTGLLRSTSGTLNYPNDDNQIAKLVWSIVSGPPGAKLDTTTNQQRSDCASVTMPITRDAFPALDLTDAATLTQSLTNSLTIGVSIGDGCYLGACNMASADVMLKRVPLVDRGRLPGLPIGTTAASVAFACTQNLLAAVRGLPLSAASNVALSRQTSCLDWAFQYDTVATYSSTTQTTLEVRYVAAVASAQSTQLATAPGRLVYSPTEAGNDDAGLPAGMHISASYGLQDLKVAFSGDTSNTRPLQEVPLAANQRDYAPQVGAPNVQGAALLAAQYSLVANSNFNAGAGGAVVGLYALYWSPDAAPIPTDSSRAPAAVTDLRLVGEAEVELSPAGEPRSAAWGARGYRPLPQNLLAQSDRGAVYLFVRRGSGPPVIQVTATPPAGWPSGSAPARYAEANLGGYRWAMTNASNAAGSVAVVLYFQFSSESVQGVRRTLVWTPCQVPGTQALVCGTAAERQHPPPPLATPSLYQGQMQCLLTEVHAKPAPSFSRCDEFGAAVTRAGVGGLVTSTAAMQGCQQFGGSKVRADVVYQARMGRELLIPVVVQNQLYRPWDLTRVAISSRSGVAAGSPANWTGPSGARLYSSDSVGASVENQLNSPSANVDNPDDSVRGGLVSWTPGPKDGAWAGSVCVEVCVPGDGCPADPALPGFDPSAALCSTYCVAVGAWHFGL